MKHLIMVNLIQIKYVYIQLVLKLTVCDKKKLMHCVNNIGDIIIEILILKA